MNISEAAKKAAEDIVQAMRYSETNAIKYPDDVEIDGFSKRIQSAIDAETAAKDAEIARLTAEVDANKHWRDTVDRVVGEYGELEAERTELVEALKEIHRYAGRYRSFDEMTDIKNIASDALNKFGGAE